MLRHVLVFALSVALPAPALTQELPQPRPATVAALGALPEPDVIAPSLPRAALRPLRRPAVTIRPPKISDRPIARPANVYRVDGARLNEPAPDCDAGEQVCIRLAHRLPDTCAAIFTLARDHDLPPGYFARLIWRESLFDPYAISHAGALGIAQFMPATARLRGLVDPFNPAAALATSAAYLADLSERFGNLGLAAVAYNGGEDRAARFKAGSSGLPGETRAYVQGITGHTAETWRDAPPETVDFRLDGDTPFLSACVAKGTTRTVPQFPTGGGNGGTGGGKSQPTWAVVIAAHQNKAVAESRLNAAAARSPQIRAERPTVKRVKLATMRTAQYTALIGKPNQSAALSLCNAIRRSGVPCLVRRN